MKLLMNKAVISDQDNPEGYHIVGTKVRWYNGNYQYLEHITPYRRHDNKELLYLVGVRLQPMCDEDLDYFQKIKLSEPPKQRTNSKQNSSKAAHLQS